MDLWEVREQIFLLFILGARGRLGKEQYPLAHQRAGCFANLPEDEKHILFASQCSQKRAFGERIELLGSYVEARDEFMVVANLVQDGTFLW